MNIDKRLISLNYTPQTNQRLGICIHTMVGTLNGTDSWFRNPNAKVSSHYGVDLLTDQIYQWVEEKHIAWTQGIKDKPTNELVLEKGGNPNSYLISIECADGGNPETDRSFQKHVLAELVADIAKRNNIPLDRKYIMGHREIYSVKSCPGSIDVEEIVTLAKSINGETLLNLSEDIPTEVEDRLGLKEYEWYDKHWTLEEFMIGGVNAYEDFMEIEDRMEILEGEFATLQKHLKETSKKYADLLEDYELLKEEKDMTLSRAFKTIIESIKGVFRRV